MTRLRRSPHSRTEPTEGSRLRELRVGNRGDARQAGVGGEVGMFRKSLGLVRGSHAAGAGGRCRGRCGGGDDGGGGGGKTIALLLPENHTPRYESRDRPEFEAKVKELCSDCKILYSNADAGRLQAAEPGRGRADPGRRRARPRPGRRRLRGRDRHEGQGAERAGRQLRPPDHELRRRLLRLVRQRRRSASCRATR